MARALSQDLRDRVISAVDGVSNSHNVTMFSLLEPYGVHRHLVEHIDKEIAASFFDLGTRPEYGALAPMALCFRRSWLKPSIGIQSNTSTGNCSSVV